MAFKRTRVSHHYPEIPGRERSSPFPVGAGNAAIALRPGFLDRLYLHYRTHAFTSSRVNSGALPSISGGGVPEKE
jgi:hypothetical protein